MIQGEKASAMLREEARLVEMRLLGLTNDNPAQLYLRELAAALNAGADALRDRDYVRVRGKMIRNEDLLG